MTTCTGTHYQRQLPSEGESVRLMLCTGCREATLIIGISAVGTYDSAEEAENAYKNRITEGMI